MSNEEQNTSKQQICSQIKNYFPQSNSTVNNIGFKHTYMDRDLCIKYLKLCCKHCILFLGNMFIMSVTGSHVGVVMSLLIPKCHACK